MPGVTQCESQTVLAKASPTRKNRLSLRFFQKKETKRTLDFAETPQPEIQNVEEKEPEVSDQVVPATQLSPPACCAKKESLVPFVGFNNLGNTCYLNSILQVLCYCPGFKNGIKHLYDLISKKRETSKDDKEKVPEKDGTKEDLPASYEVICSLSSLVHSAEHLQLSFLLNPENYDTELAAQPRRLLNTLRELNPMYEGYLQHDAQEVLQCILGNIQEACQALKKEMRSLQVQDMAKPQPEKESNPCETSAITLDKSQDPSLRPLKESDVNGKRKNENDVGNAKKRTKLSKEPPPLEEQRVTRSKRKTDKQDDKADSSKTCTEASTSNPTHKKSRLGLNWLKSGKQPSILSKFCSLSRSSSTSPKSPPAECQAQSTKPELGRTESEELVIENGGCKQEGNKDSETSQNESTAFDLVEKLFQGQLVLRTRCLECECFTERREDFQDISVPVQENEPPKPEENSDISPDPRIEIKTLKWAISQFASVERIVGEDKYFCENCHHYTEAERSLLFDKIPEIVTIHLKCFAANSSEFDCYGGLSKVNTPLLTPLQLSLEEWSTKPSKHLYSLFAVVMHSGVTISSGHYTAYVKLNDLNNFELDQIKSPSNHQDIIKTEPLTQDVQTSDENHEGEISFRASTNVPSSNKVNKKGTDAVGLLGGQKSKSDFEQLPTPKTPKTERISSMSDDKVLSDAKGGLHSDNEQKAQSFSEQLGSSKSAAHLLQILKEYEGSWLLFDDSEVKVTEERDFLTTISPTTQSTSTPYLLFYRRLAE